MQELTHRRDQLTTALARFLAEGTGPESLGVPHHVAASWRRSASRGVRPHAVVSSYATDLDVDSRLVSCSRQEIARLAEDIADVPASVALTDARARILLRSDTGASIGRTLDRVDFAQGFGYAEDSVGTNGVGTVLEFGTSVQIVGAEHFVEPLQAFACSGAPVRDPFTGRIQGVLDISCHAEDSHPLLASLVRRAAARIERNLLHDRDGLPQALFDAYRRLEARNHGAVLAVGPRQSTLNTAMQTLAGPVDQQLLIEHARFVMTCTDSVDERIELPSGSCVRLRGATVRVGADLAGLVAVVVPVREVDVVPAPRSRPDRLEVAADGSRSPAAVGGDVGGGDVGGGDVGGGDVGGEAPSRSVSPAWRAAAATTRAAIAAGTGVVVLGEPGTGRTRLLRESLAELAPRDRVVVLDPGSVLTDADRATPRTRDREVWLIRDIDRLTAPVAGALRGRLAALPSGSLLLATSTGDADPGLLGLFSTSVRLPALRFRQGDVPDLCRALLAELVGRRRVTLSPAAIRVLARHEWPGNVAELRDALSAALRSRPVGVIEVTDLPASCQSEPRSVLRPVDQLERDAIVAALRASDGNRKAAATALGLARSTLYRKIHQYGIDA